MVMEANYKSMWVELALFVDETCDNLAEYRECVPPGDRTEVIDYFCERVQDLMQELQQKHLTSGEM